MGYAGYRPELGYIGGAKGAGMPAKLLFMTAIQSGVQWESLSVLDAMV